ncbi:DarT ssDNA thymidine ADP-ribosyltransferase family protein [uncultured Shewanella sp.]|uniref:DarT ssDNA thymidine ADP-ribosyltransferase family protein n=1 Tax=uncultured Shewanella sp. TaxID=173975 RepID=UPI002621358A|nr:DarT ssDNA thymidine ADP-ribosyltransferase family protein [uncultured Shewanella sp.]
MRVESAMLFVIHKGHPDFQCGQDRVIHLISDVDTIRLSNQYCFFTDIHADLDYAEQIEDFGRISELEIKRIINEKYWQDFKEEKQAEFLVFESVQWNTIRQIGVKTQAIADEVNALLYTSLHKPEVVVRPEWYF